MEIRQKIETVCNAWKEINVQADWKSLDFTLSSMVGMFSLAYVFRNEDFHELPVKWIPGCMNFESTESNGSNSIRYYYIEYLDEIFTFHTGLNQTITFSHLPKYPLRYSASELQIQNLRDEKFCSHLQSKGTAASAAAETVFNIIFHNDSRWYTKVNHVLSTIRETPLKKCGVNDPCTCQSGRKFKKCCFLRI